MTTTEKFQNIPDYYIGTKEDCLNQSKNEEIKQTNPRYLSFTQKHFTAGDEEQFEYYRDARNYNLCKKEISLKDNIFKDNKIYKEWEKYKNVEATAVINTFRYIFNKFKKGIFVKIANNKLVVFLPFSKSCYKNEWSKEINIDPKYNDLYSFLEHIHNLQEFPFPFNNRTVNIDKEQWYGNNCIIRYDMKKVGKYYYPSEGDTNIGTIKNMLEILCKGREIPDIEFFINRRDFPILTRDGTEPYNNIWNTKNKALISHSYGKYVPILSMSTSNRYADIAMPTYEDWARVQNPDIRFPEFCKTLPENWYNFNKKWEKKRETAVFRGSSTGCGVTLETNVRLKLAYMSNLGEVDENGIPYLDAGITKWNLRPRKIEGEKYLKTFEIDKLPFKKIGFLTPEEQSNYKYIINVDGHVSAFRLSIELVMGSVILMVDSDWEIWYKKMLKPYEHYVPIKKDLSDLIEQIKWCKKNDEKCKEIARNAETFYFKYLQKDGIVDYLQKTLVDLKEEMGMYLYNNENILEKQISEELKSFSYNYPKTNKNIKNIRKLPNVGRNNSLLQAMQWIFNMIIGEEKNIEEIGIQDKSFIISNKLSKVTKWNLIGFDFVIKSTTDEQKKIEHIHDVYVGIEGINELSKLIPNFAYTFGYYENDGKVNAIIEYINGETLYDYIKSSNFKFDEYLLIIIQICLALEVAQNKCGLVHYDITPWNIILQRTSEPITIDYVLEYNKILRIKTTIIPIIIDYGKSHIVVEQEHHGFINMFNFSTIQDILTLLITSINQILSDKRLEKNDFSSMLYLANFLSGNKYRQDKFNNAVSMKQFLKKAGKYSCLITDNKYELEEKTPLDLIKYIYKLKDTYPLLLNSFGNAKNPINNLMDKSNARQIFEYILSDNIEEQLESYINVFARLKQCSIPLSKNLLLNYYSVQMLEKNLLSVKNDMLEFLKINRINSNKYEKIINNTFDYLKKVYSNKISLPRQKNIEYNIEDFINSESYTKEIFLEPKNVLKYLEKYNNRLDELNEYKDIIQNILINNGNYKLSDNDKSYYIRMFSSLLKIKSNVLLISNANIYTMRIISKYLYKRDLLQFENINDKCANIIKYELEYKSILKLNN